MASASSSSGGLLSSISYTHDGSFLLAASGHVVKLFSAATGVQVRTLAAHTASVTAVAHSPTAILQAYSAALDGRVILWDLDEAAPLRTICVGLPILSMVLDPTRPETAFILTGAVPAAGSAARPAAR